MAQNPQSAPHSEPKKRGKDDIPEPEEVGLGCFLMLAAYAGPAGILGGLFTLAEGDAKEGIPLIIFGLLCSGFVIVQWKWRERTKQAIGALSRAVGSIRGPADEALSAAPLHTFLGVPLQILQITDITRRMKSGDACETERASMFLWLLAAVLLPPAILVLIFLYCITRIFKTPRKVAAHQEKQSTQQNLGGDVATNSKPDSVSAGVRRSPRPV